MWVVAARYEAGLGTAEDKVQAVRWLLQMMHRRNGDGFHEALRIARGVPMDDVRRGPGSWRTARLTPKRSYMWQETPEPCTFLASQGPRARTPS